MPPTVTLAQIAEFAQVQRPSVSNWRRRHPDFPPPVGGTSDRPAFDADAVADWLDRRPMPPRNATAGTPYGDLFRQGLRRSGQTAASGLGADTLAHLGLELLALRTAHNAPLPSDPDDLAALCTEVQNTHPDLAGLFDQWPRHPEAVPAVRADVERLATELGTGRAAEEILDAARRRGWSGAPGRCAWNMWPNPPSDTNQIPTVHAKIDFGAHRLFFRLICQAEPEAAVDLEFVVGFRLAQRGDQVAEFVEDGGDVGRVKAADCWWPLRDLAAVGEGSLAFGLGLGDPAGYQDRVGPGVERGSVAFELGVVDPMGVMEGVAARVAAGATVEFRPTGTSMVPLIASRALVTVAPVEASRVEVGDIVLAKVAGTIYLHLVSAVDTGTGRVQISNNRGRVNGWTSHARV